VLSLGDFSDYNCISQGSMDCLIPVMLLSVLHLFSCLGLYRIYFFPMRPEPDFAGFGMTNPAGAGLTNPAGAGFSN